MLSSNCSAEGRYWQCGHTATVLRVGSSSAEQLLRPLRCLFKRGELADVHHFHTGQDAQALQTRIVAQSVAALFFRHAEPRLGVTGDVVGLLVVFLKLVERLAVLAGVFGRAVFAQLFASPCARLRPA